MKYKSAKGTTINIPDGLSAKQIAAIKKDADAGYGTRAQQTANELGKKLSASPAAPKTVEQQIQRTEQEIAKREKAGQAATPGLTQRLETLRGQASTPTAPVDPAAPTTPTTPTDNNPNTTFGRKSVDAFLDGILDTYKPLDLSNAPKVMTAADLEAYRQQNQESLYNEETKYLDRNRSRQLEEKKQELANRGIPYNPAEEFNPNSKDLYGRTIGAINENYATEQRSALDRARAGADARMATQAQVNQSARDSFINSAVGQYQSQLDSLSTGNDLLNSLITEYGMTRDEALAKMKMKSDERIAKYRTAASGGGGGSSSGGSSGGGFEMLS